MAIIEFNKVCKSFGNNQVLDNADLSIEKGETITIIGGSGKGKTVFLKLLLGVLKSNSGKILFNGKDVGEMDERGLVDMRKKIGMLFQGAALFDSLTVADNVAYPIRQHFDYDEFKIREIVKKKLSLVGLPGIEDMMPADLSGGMKKRVGLARAIATDPDVILYDEPTTGLDPANTRRICNLILELQRKLFVTSIVVTHDLESAFRITDRIALIHERRFSFVGSKEDARQTQDPVVKHFIAGELETADG